MKNSDAYQKFYNQTKWLSHSLFMSEWKDSMQALS